MKLYATMLLPIFLAGESIAANGLSESKMYSILGRVDAPVARMSIPPTDAKLKKDIANRDRQITELKSQVDRLLKALEGKHKARVESKSTPSYMDVTVYETKTEWYEATVPCATCPSGFRVEWKQRTSRVPVKKTYRVYDPPAGYADPGIYEDNGRKYFWDGRQSTWIDQSASFRSTPRRQFRGIYGRRYYGATIPQFRYTDRYGRPNGIIRTAAKGTANLCIGLFSILF